MRNKVISPRFDEDQYKGQDVVHYGVRIPIAGHKPMDVFSKFSKDAQNRINLKESNIYYREMTDSDLSVLRQMWFDPNDSTFPSVMGNHVGIVAEIGEVPRKTIAGAIWKPEGRNLFLHQLVSGKEGKDMNAPTNLIWQSVLKYQNFAIGGAIVNSLDIGVSYNPDRYRFFKHFAVETYPIILKRPELVPVIRLSPFRGIKDLDEERHNDIEGKNATFFPRGSYALYGALKYLNIGVGDNVVIVKTFGSHYISACVTKMIEKTGAHWTLRSMISQNTKAVIAIHEFGIPVFQDDDLKILQQARALGVPVIEDCAWRSDPVWEWSRFAVFSFPKLMNINYGGMLYGVKLDKEFLWSIGVYDFVKRERIWWEPKRYEGADKRIKNWEYYDSLVRADGMQPDKCYPYKDAIEQGDWVPTVYLQRFKDEKEAQAIVERLEDFGIQAGMYWGEPVVFLPVHQNMDRAEVEYMFAVIRGYFNTCRDYGKKV